MKWKSKDYILSYEVILDCMKNNLHDRNQKTEEHPDINVLDPGSSWHLIGQTGQHGCHHQHGLEHVSIKENNKKFYEIVKVVTVRLMVMM